MNNYNYARFLSRCIESLLAQGNSVQNEIIVVDDGSTDHSREIIFHYSRFGIKPVFKQNGGQASAFNAGVRQAVGDLVWFVDSDDELLPDASQKVIRSWVPGIAFLQCGLRLIDEDSREIGVYPGLDDLEEGDLWGRMLTRPKTRSFVHSPTTGLIFSRRALLSAMPLPEAAWRVNADGLLVVQASRFGRTRVIREYLGNYRLHGNNAWAPVLFARSQSDPERQARLLLHDADRRVALAPFVREHQTCRWEMQQARFLEREAKELRELASGFSDATLSNASIVAWEDSVERRALGRTPWRHLDPPPAHFDIWQATQRGVTYRTSDWPSNCPWAFGFDFNPWIERRGPARSINRICGIRVRPTPSHGGIAHLLLMAADQRVEEIELAVFVQGARAANVKFSGFHRVSVWVPASSEVSIDFVSTGKWSLMQYAFSLIREPADYPEVDLDPNREVDLEIPTQQARAAFAATRQGMIADFAPRGLIIVDPSQGEGDASLDIAEGLRFSLPLKSFQISHDTDLSHRPVLLSRIDVRSPLVGEGPSRGPMTLKGVLGGQAEGTQFVSEVATWDSLLARFPETNVEGIDQQHYRLPIAALPLWSSRPDLQDAFDLTSNSGRLGYYAWLRHEANRGAVIVRLDEPCPNESQLCAVLSVNRTKLDESTLSESTALLQELNRHGRKDDAIPPHLLILWVIRPDLRDHAPDLDCDWLERMYWWWNRYGAREHGLSHKSLTMPLRVALTRPGRLLMRVMSR